MEHNTPAEFRIIVAGSRDLCDYSRFRKRLLNYLKRFPEGSVELVVGMCKDGPDDMGYHFARWDVGIPYKPFPANWKEYGNSAGFKRNVEMAEYGNHLYLEWDGKSHGSKHMLDIAKDKGLACQVFVLEPFDTHPMIVI